MTTIYYHIEKQKWFQCEVENGLNFGKTDTIVPFVGSSPEQGLPFSVKKDGNKVGPIIGILTGSSKDNTFIGNLAGLKRILLSLQQNGALGIVITPLSIREWSVEAFTFYQPLQTWIKLRTPLPSAVYNRIPYRHMEESQDFMDVVSFCKTNDIPFFNPYFFSKWEVYQMLKENDVIHPFLPETTLLKDKNDLNEMLIKHQILYLKSSTGHKGIDLYRIKAFKHGVIVETPHGKQSYPTLTSFWEKYKDGLVKTDYLLQKAVQADTYEGKRYDLRLLCHYHKNGHFISGIGVRVEGENGVTTHVPNGGSIIPFELVRDRFDKATLQTLVYEIGKSLMNKTGEFIGEYSVDLGRSEDGHIFIYEINSKPMVFDEPQIREKGLENLTKLLIMKAKTT
ncbi:YheC/YheD family protein [Bacillus sp. REN16]|uniref:YheC/YheD family endospore coat-associated protein n=1 Tax=Bacillus sp. REN16 TaxID=2887296 RepID=UPI001E595DE9|nr:YheC/YheD family protein [Bacillus sp. REN16]MCC3355405.1 YheC/YheD family protein [Bacillus sp. REN16]